MSLRVNLRRPIAVRPVLLILVVAGFLLSPSVAFSDEAEVRWTHPGTTEVDGFRVYIGRAPGEAATNPASDVDVGMPPLGTDGVYLATINLSPGTFYLAVRAYNAAGLSAISNELEYVDGVVPLGAPGLPQLVSP